MKGCRLRLWVLAAASLWIAGTGAGGLAVLRAGEAAPDFYLPGSLSITLHPGGLWQIVTAKDDAGNWITNDESWRTSGAVESGLAPGRYTVAVRAPNGFGDPEPLTVEVFGGADASRTVALREVTVYGSVAEIPPQSVRIGDTLKFIVEGGASLAPAPVGRDLSFDGRVFTYRPGVEEREQFALNFTGPAGESLVLVTPQPRLPAEASVIEYRGDFLPLEESAERKSYLTVLIENRTRSTQEGPLNLRADRNVRNVTISGPRVVFAPGHENDLWKSFGYDQLEHPVDDIESMAIYADQVIIRGPLHLPETDVIVHARELRFEDTDGTAQLITTPLEAPGRAINGARGHAAGDVKLYVGALYAPGSALRLILKGGDGQEAVEGANGTPLVPAAKTFTTYDVRFTAQCIIPPVSHDSPDMPSNVTYYKYDECCGACIKRGDEGTLTCPRSGDDASPNGVPGNGGNGGGLTCAFDLGAIADLTPGRAGQSQPARTGSAGDKPYNAVQIYNYFNCFCEWGHNSWQKTKECKNVAGANRPATTAPGPSPTAGALIGESPFEWLHPVAIRSLIAFAKDAYLNGYPDDARGLLEPYRKALQAFSDRPADRAPDLGQLEDEIAALIHQIDSHLDFFGFPAGWVPMLSFEVTLGLFQDEVKAAGDILYLSHYLTLEAAKAVNKAGALDRVRSEMAKEIAAFQTRLESARAKLASLSIQARSIDKGIADTRAALEARQDELRDQAKLTAALKKAFRVAGNVLPLIPVGQPALGLAGAGFTAASKFNEQSALDGAIEATNLAHVYLQAELDQQLQEFQTAQCTIPAECGLKAAFLAQQKALEGLDAGLVAVNQTLEEVKTWESDVDKEVQILAAEDPAHKDLVKRVRDLNGRKRRFAEEMVVALQEALQLANGINQGFLALDNLNRDSVKTSAKIDQEAFAYIREMGQRAKERLLKFQYYMVKAYHYRTLRPYHAIPGGNKVFQLKEIFDHFENEFFTDDFSKPNVLDASLVDLYADQVRQVTAEIVDHLIAERPEQTATLNLELTPDELARLNRWDDSLGENPEGDLRINLVERGVLFDQGQENLRIFDLKVHTLEVAPRPGTIAANVTVFVRHSGESLISSKGETYKFNHYRTLKQASITWRGIYDSVLKNHSSPELSAAGDSLLETLLGGLDGEEVPDDLLLYSRPSAWADLIVTKETLGDQEMLVERLVLQLKVDFSEKETQAELEVAAQGLDGEPLSPNILLSQPDGNSRRDGRGIFRRTYEPGEAVSLKAPEIYGAYVFDRWVDRRGETAALDPTLALTLPLSNSATVSKYRALYRYSPGGVLPGKPFERGDVNGDAQVDISDGIAQLSALFTGGPLATCQKAADANDDGVTDISDAIYVLAFLFTGGSAPPPPSAACGPDSTPDSLTCEHFGPCL